MQLPIDLIPGTNPPRFKWHASYDNRKQECSGVVHPSIEQALVELITLTKTQQKQIIAAQERIAELSKPQSVPQGSASKKK